MASISFAEYRKKSRMVTVELYTEAPASLLAVRGILMVFYTPLWKLASTDASIF
jgi:hypothetical protein